MRSVFLHKDKSIFKIDELPAERFATSLGLPGAPKIKLLSKDAVKKRKNAAYVEKEIKQTTHEASESEQSDDSASGNESSEVDSDGEADHQAQREPFQAPWPARRARDCWRGLIAPLSIPYRTISLASSLGQIRGEVLW